MMTIQLYVGELQARLTPALLPEYLEEAVEETRTHLTERAEELKSGGLEPLAAEAKAVQEFGDVGEIADSFIKSYPPRPPLDPKGLDGIFKFIGAIWVALAVFVFVNTGGLKGLEAVAAMALTNSPMLVIPGLFGGLGRLKYRRMKPVKAVTVLGNIGFGMAVFGTVTIVALQAFGKNPDAAMLPFYLCFSAVSFIAFAIMRSSQEQGRIFTFLTVFVRAK